MLIKKPELRCRDYILFYRTSEVFFYVDVEDTFTNTSDICFPILKSIVVFIEVLGKVYYDQPISQDTVRIFVDKDYINSLSGKIKECFEPRFPNAEIKIVES